jgi:hypothetical protein
MISRAHSNPVYANRQIATLGGEPHRGECNGS